MGNTCKRVTLRLRTQCGKQAARQKLMGDSAKVRASEVLKEVLCIYLTDWETTHNSKVGLRESSKKQKATEMWELARNMNVLPEPQRHLTA